jgi:hypothetical protein
MAAIDGKITLSTCEGRPCWVRGRRAIFHRWTDSARPVKPVSGDQDTDERLQKWSVHGLVEYEDGRMEREWPNNIRFADSREYFDGLAWEEMEARRDAEDHEERETLDDLPERTNPDCITCAHENPMVWSEACAINGYDCLHCEADCICKTCENSSKWEPKETPANG